MYIIGREKFCTISIPTATDARTYICKKKSGENILLSSYRASKRCWRSIIVFYFQVIVPHRRAPAPKISFTSYNVARPQMGQMSTPTNFGE